MSRCKACNVILNNFEMTRRDQISGDYSELCSLCLSISNDAVLDGDNQIEYHFDILSLLYDQEFLSCHE